MPLNRNYMDIYTSGSPRLVLQPERHFQSLNCFSIQYSDFQQHVVGIIIDCNNPVNITVNNTRYCQDVEKKTGMEWNGFEWNRIEYWNGMEQNRAEQIGIEWIEIIVMEQNRENGMEWNRTEQNRIGQIGMEWKPQTLLKCPPAKPPPP